MHIYASIELSIIKGGEDSKQLVVSDFKLIQFYCYLFNKFNYIHLNIIMKNKSEL